MMRVMRVMRVVTVRVVTVWGMRMVRMVRVMGMVGRRVRHLIRSNTRIGWALKILSIISIPPKATII